VPAVFALAAVYFLAGKLGLRLATTHESSTLVWPPTALALSALLLWGYRLWPGVLLGAFLVNITTKGTVPTCAGIAVGNTLEALVGAWLVNRFAGGRRAFERAPTILRALALAGLLSTTVSATFGVGSHLAGGTPPPDGAGMMWLTWWLGDVVSDFVLAPVLLLWAANHSVRWTPGRLIEAGCLLAAVAVSSLVVFGGWPSALDHQYPIFFLSVPVLLWPAFRFGPRETASAALVMAGIALHQTIRGRGPFGDSLIQLQAFMGISAALVLVLAAVVTERAQARGGFVDVQARNAAILETALDAIITIDHEGRITEFNPAAERIFGYARDAVLGRTLAETIIPPNLREAHARGLRRYLETGEGPVLRRRLELTGLRADGTEFPVELAIVPVLLPGRPPFFTGYLRDITERRRAEAELKQARDDLEVRVRERTAELSHAISVLTQEIDDRKRAEREAQLYADIVKSAHIGMSVLHLESLRDARSFRIVATNPAADQVVGVPLGPYVSRPLVEVFPRAYELGLAQIFAEVVRSGRARNIGEVQYGDDKIPEGTFAISAFPLPDQRVCVAFENITERKRLERERELLNARLLEGQKLQAIGELAAGVAHEINNPTAYIISNLNTLSEYLSDLASFVEQARAGAAADELERSYRRLRLDFVLDDFKKAIGDSREGGERIREIVRSLKEFSHADEGEVRPTDLEELLESALRICWNEIKYKASVRREYERLPLVPCYPQRINQVFMNLLVNAAQAIPQKGEIVVATRREQNEAVVRISDNGAGIAPEHLSKLFEPFFTTKPVGKGTGLGLHVARKVVTAHGGRIDVVSAVGEGSTFTVRLPLVFQGQVNSDPARVK
jgi:PAS domain S-box-containing protein